MAQAIFTAFFNMIGGIVNMVTSPISSLVSKFVPNFASMIQQFNYFVNRFVIGGVSYFLDWIPIQTLTTLSIFVNCLVLFYGFYLSIYGILKLFKVIKNIKFW